MIRVHVTVRDYSTTPRLRNDMAKDLMARGSYRPRELRIKIYREILQLRERGLGYKRIRKIIEEKYGERLSLATICEWVGGIHSPLNGRKIPSMDYLQPSGELAYIIGARFGDGTVVRMRKKRKGYNETRVVLSVKDREFVEEFARCLGVVLGREPPKIRYVPIQQRYHASVRNKTLFELLHKCHLDKVRPFIEHCDECKAKFLRGVLRFRRRHNRRWQIESMEHRL